MHPCFLPYVQIYWISVRLLMSHEKCPIWQVLFILKFGTFAFFSVLYCTLFKFIMVYSKCPKCHTCFFPFCLILFVSTVWKSLYFQVSHFFFLPYQFLNNSIIKTLNVCHVILFFLLNSVNYMFGKNIEYLLRTSKNHLVHNACVKIPHVSKK